MIPSEGKIEIDCKICRKLSRQLFGEEYGLVLCIFDMNGRLLSTRKVPRE